VSERTRYIRQFLTEHPLNSANYEFIPPHAIKKALSDQRQRFLDIYSKFSYSLPSEGKETYFRRALSKNNLNGTRVPQIYGIFKVHKNGPPKTRPIVSCVNSIPEIFSKWVDFWLKKIVRDILPTYIRDAEDLQKELKKSFPNGLPPNAKLFSVDAVGMYPNIDTPHGIEVLTRWLTDHRDELPPSTPSEFLLPPSMRS
jgi:hypothetical protein